MGRLNDDARAAIHLAADDPWADRTVRALVADGLKAANREQASA